MAKADKLVTAYIKMRDEKTKITREHKDAVGVLDEKMDLVANELSKMMDDVGTDSFKTSAGTAFKTTKDQTGVLEIEEFREFLSAQAANDDKELAAKIYDNFPWHFFTKAVSKPAVIAFMKDNDGRTPDGIRYEQFIETQVRKQSYVKRRKYF